MATIQEALGEAVKLHEAGKISQAEILYGRILKAEPRQPEALYFYGILAAQGGRLQLASDLLGKAVVARRGVAEYHVNFGNVLRLLGRADDAIVQYGTAVSLNPALAGIQAERGFLLVQQNRAREALECLRHATTVEPTLSAAHAQLGQLFQQAGALEGAARHYRHALALRPDMADVAYNLGVLEHERGNLPEAITAARRALSARPDFPAALYNLGNALSASMGDVQNQRCAEMAYHRALALQPGHAPAYANLGALLQNRKGKVSEAVAACRRALRLRPDLAAALATLSALRISAKDAASLPLSRLALAVRPDSSGGYVNLGSALRASGLSDQALDAIRRARLLEPDHAPAFTNLTALHRERDELPMALRVGRHAVALSPDVAQTLANFGLALQDDDELDAAVAFLGRALRLAPDDAETRKALGIAQMRKGRLVEGFANYASRWDSPDFAAPRRDFPQPMWAGEGLAAHRLLLWGEQGVGDELIYASMIPELTEEGVDCALECDPRLVPLLARSFPTVEVVGRSPTLSPPRLTRPADRHCPLGSIGRWLRPEISRFPRRLAFLKPDTVLRDQLRDRYEERAPGNRLVGLSWRSKNATLGRNKSFDLRSLAPILTRPDLTFVNLQYGDCRDELEAVRRELGVAIIADAQIDPMRDLDGFAAQVSALDLVISTSNTTVHVAGGLGVPCWMLLPKGQGSIWYWFSEREDSPWYPALRLFRQSEPGDWAAVIDRVAAALPSPLR